MKPCYKPFPDESDTSLGAALKRKRLELEWTQQDTADYFGILKDSYQKWEWNQNIPDIKKRKTVIKFLGFNYWDDGTNTLSNRVKLYRIEYGLYRNDLAKQIGVSDSTIERIEKNRVLVSDELLKLIEKYIFH